jgi:YidC/Oxa1 family membrane protein insertase
MDPFTFAVDLLYRGVDALSALLAPLGGGAALAIVVLTLIVRAALIPVGISQVKAEWMRRRLAPKLQSLQLKYKTNPKKLQEKTLALYKAEKASPLAGIGPSLAQAPVLATVYALFIRASVDGHANALLTATMLNVPLGSTIPSLVAAGALWPGLVMFGVLLLVITASAVISRRSSVATGWLSWLPLIAVPFAAVVPLAATLYLSVSTLWTLGERAILRRRYWVSV